MMSIIGKKEHAAKPILVGVCVCLTLVNGYPASSHPLVAGHAKYKDIDTTRNSQADLQSTLEIRASPGMTATGNRGQYDFGHLDLGQKQSVSYRFLLKNAGQRPLIIGRLQPSCHCTSSKVDDRLRKEPGVVPGQPIEIEVTVKLPTQSGPVDEFVAVYGIGNANPAALLEISGRIDPAYLLTPQDIQLEKAPHGDTKVIWVNLSRVVDGRNAPGPIPTAISSSPSVTVALSQSFKPAEGASWSGQVQESYSYKLVCKLLARKGTQVATVSFYRSAAGYSRTRVGVVKIASQ